MGFLRDALSIWVVNQPDMFPNWAEWPGFRALAMPNALPQLSLQAFALSFFGRLQNVESAKVAGAQSYGQALVELKANLQNPTTEQKIDIIIAITIFKAYEVRLIQSMQALSLKAHPISFSSSWLQVNRLGLSTLWAWPLFSRPLVQPSSPPRKH